MAYYGISSNLIVYLTTRLHQGTVDASNSVTNWVGTVFLKPILEAYVADAHLGRYWTFVVASAIYLLDFSPSLRNLLLLDAEGKRVAVKYFSDDWPTHSAKLAFERSIFTKTLKANACAEAEIAMFDGYVVVYKFVRDLHFFVTAGDDENELILATVLHGFYNAVSNILRNDVDKRTALENLDMILLCIDEIVDGGIILEIYGGAIAGKVATNSTDGSVAFSEQNISQALATARDHLARSFLQ